jgi:hypothetical protein
LIVAVEIPNDPAVEQTLKEKKSIDEFGLSEFF